jgi:uncharacterized protein (DUF1800 family)
LSVTRRKFLQLGGGAALVATVGCDQISSALLPGYKVSADATGPFQPPASDSIDPVSHYLNRLTFGARPRDYQRVRRLAKETDAAADAYLAAQLNPQAIDDSFTESVVRRFETLNESIGELFEYQENLLLSDLVRATLVRATFSERQLYEVMVQFWSDHFNIDPSKGDCKWLKTADDRDVIRRHALGRFPEMLRASALSPAMLWYLDGRSNRKASGEDKPNENYARELLELHTLGVHGGYSQRDVMEVARCLTGWTVRSKKPLFDIGKVEFDPHLHDMNAKEVLGHRIPAISDRLPREERARCGAQELERVLEIVQLHPATARHLATKLCRHFIADEPASAAVETVAKAFTESQGDIRATLRALFTTPEFQNSRGGKFKRPFHFLVSALRATGATTDAKEPLADYLSRMGHLPFHYPTPDGYPEQAEPWLATLLWRWNFAATLAENRIPGTRIKLDLLKNDLGGDKGLMAHLLGRRPSPEEVESYHRSGAGLALLLASPAFQRC